MRTVRGNLEANRSRPEAGIVHACIGMTKKDRRTGRPPGRPYGGLKVYIWMRYYDRNVKKARTVRGGAILIKGMLPTEIRSMIEQAARDEAERRRAALASMSKREKDE